MYTDRYYGESKEESIDLSGYRLPIRLNVGLNCSFELCFFKAPKLLRVLMTCFFAEGVKSILASSVKCLSGVQYARSRSLVLLDCYCCFGSARVGARVLFNYFIFKFYQMIWQVRTNHRPTATRLYSIDQLLNSQLWNVLSMDASDLSLVLVSCLDPFLNSTETKKSEIE